MNFKARLSVLLILAFLVCAVPMTAAATEYTPADGETLDISAFVSDDVIRISEGKTVTLNGNSVPLTQIQIICEAGVTLTLRNVIIANTGYSGICPLTFTGAQSKLILPSGTTSTLTSSAKAPGISVAAPADLKLENDGTLTVKGGMDYPGSGSAGLKCPSGTSLTISGSGTLNATGVGGGAGIGGGLNNGVNMACGTITINSGTVVAKGGGVRGSNSFVSSISGTAITISGGTVYAGPTYGGIGGTSSEGSSISIKGGNVTATGSYGGPGIGGAGSLGCDVTITGGTVTSLSNKTAAIGRCSRPASTDGSVLITGGTVIAQSSGFNFSGIDCSSTAPGTITITGGIVTASGEVDGFGILGSYSGTGTVTISGGTVTATGGTGNLPGGGSPGSVGSSGICASSTGTGSIEISGGTVYTGGGKCDLGNGILSAADTLSITGSAMVFLQNNNYTTPPTTTHTNTTYPIGTTEVYGTGIAVPDTWTGDFGAYLRTGMISYDINGGSGTAPGSVTQLYGTTIDLPDDSSFSRSHYQFGGWNTAPDGSGNSYAAGSKYTLADTATLYAEWACTTHVNSTFPSWTLTDSATGVTVSGDIYRNAELTVQNIALHLQHTCPACDEIRKAQADGRCIFGFDIDLSQGFLSDITVSIPVGASYDGQTIDLLHCVSGRLEVLSAVVENGRASFTVSSLSPFAVTTSLLVPSSSVTDPPKTGSPIFLLGFAMISIAVICMGIITIKRRES